MSQANKLFWSIRPAGGIWVLPVRLLCLWLLTAPGAAQVVINELMYHPVEEPIFTAEGVPILDLSDDVHEYVEIHNAGGLALSLSGWRLDGGIRYTFPNGVNLAAGGYLVVAKDPARLAAVSAYGLALETLQGPYAGQLSNNGETVELRNAAGQIIDAVSFSERFPWPGGADALGASERWTGIDPMVAQYRGRSLERVSVSHSSQDPANWLASPWPGEPSPGRANAVLRTVPFPVVVEAGLAQASNGQSIIGSNQAARLTLRFSATNELRAVRLEYFVDELNRTNEATTNVVMSGPAPEFSASLPGLAGRSVVRYRVWAERLPREGGSQERVVLPREDDPFRWRGYFVTPTRVSTNDSYDLFISSNSTFQLTRNLTDNPRTGYLAPLGTTPPGGRWNQTQPAILAYRGAVHDVHVRHAGSFWRREPGRRSFKVDFPAYHRIKDYRTLMILEKDEVNAFGHRLYEEAGLPSGRTRWVDLYMGPGSRDRRLEIEEHDQQMLDRYVAERRQLDPSQPLEPTGRMFKASAFSPDTGPYGAGVPLLPNLGWEPLERYAWNYSSKNMDWEGWLPLKQLCEELAAARADLPALRAHLTAHWDVDRMLTYLAIRNWMAETDDGVHNFFLWRTGEGKWTMLGWDFDNSMSQSGYTLYSAANLFKESFLTAFREEYNQRIYWLAHTLLDPDQLATAGISYAVLPNFAPARRSAVIAQTGLGPFSRPVRPTSIAPAGSESVFVPASLQATPYAHTGTPPSAHAATIWKIRRADGTFRLPVYAVTNSGPATSLPIPFALLEPGQLYYWTCAYLDAEGHPSVNSDPASFRFGGNFQRRTVLAMNETTLWKYHAAGTNLGTAWRTPAYDDRAWPEGPPLFGVSAASLDPPVRTPLPLGRIIYYFRKSFSFAGDPTRATLRLQYLVDDGAVVFLNGAELLRENLPTSFAPGATPYNAQASLDIGDPALSSRPLSFAVTNLVAGQNVLAVEVHQKFTGSPDVIFGLTLDITTELDSSGVRVNEVMASNRSTLANGPAYPDWIELHNPTDQAQSLSGLSLTDDPFAPLKFTFPPDTRLDPHEFLLVWCDTETSQPGWHSGFSLRSEGQSIWLFNSTLDGLAQVDQLDYGLQLPDRSVGRVPDGTGAWTLNQPTPNAGNQPQDLGSTRSLRINEWMASPASGPDWFELFNPELRPVEIGGYALTDKFSAPTNSPIPALSYLGGYSFTRFIADEDPAAGADHVRFRLSGGGEEIGLFDPAQVPIDRITFAAQTSGLSQGRLPDGAATIVSLLSGASPGRSNAGDADADGLPNAWEQAYNLNPLLAQDAAEDPDGDGLTNLQEFLAGTDPTDRGDLLRVTGVTWVAGVIQLRFPLAAGKSYEVQYRESASAEPWQPLTTVGPESNARTVEVLDGNLAGTEGRFYRVVLRRAQ